MQCKQMECTHAIGTHGDKSNIHTSGNLEIISFRSKGSPVSYTYIDNTTFNTYHISSLKHCRNRVHSTTVRVSTGVQYTYLLQGWFQGPSPELVMGIVDVLHVTEHIVVTILWCVSVVMVCICGRSVRGNVCICEGSSVWVFNRRHKIPLFIIFFTSERRLVLRISSRHLMNTCASISLYGNSDLISI